MLDRYISTTQGHKDQYVMAFAAIVSKYSAWEARRSTGIMCEDAHDLENPPTKEGIIYHAFALNICTA